MFWIVALAAVAIAASVIRHAVQDHRDAEIQRREALEDLAHARAPRPAAPVSDRERTRDVQREDMPGVALPRDVTGPTPHEERARTR